MKFDIVNSNKLDTFLLNITEKIKNIKKENYKLVSEISCEKFIKDNNYSSLYNFLYNQNKNNSKYSNIKTNINTKYLSKYCNIKEYILNNNFISSIIRNKILIDFTYLNIYESESNNIKLYYFKDSKHNSKFDNRIINNVFRIINILKNLTNNFNTSNVIIFPTLFRKEIPTKYKPLGPNECNSGATFYNFSKENNGVIVIWRLEELYKVLIHELLHSFYCDFELIKNDVQIYNNYYLNEAYTETLATVLNCVIKGVFNDKDINYIKSLLVNEMNHSINQVCKIILYYKIDNRNFYNYFLNNFEEKTNVFSYYILKSALLFELPLFINVVNTKLDIIHTNIEYFINLVDKSFQSQKYKKILFNCLRKYRINRNNNSLRMTITDIN